MIIKYRKIYFIFSGILVLASLASFIIFGLKPGIDFTGGSILEMEYFEERPSNQEIREKLADLDLGSIYVQPIGEKGVIIRMKDINEDLHQKVLERINETEVGQGEISESGELNLVYGPAAEERRFESVGPVIGRELREKTNIVVVLVLLSIVLYIALAFRKIHQPLKSWYYGIVSVIALFHDILIPLGIFSFYGIEITIPVITAILAVLGYSVNNTVVVFDRIRENLLIRGEVFREIVSKSLGQTLARQVNTSLTTLLVAFAIYFFGGQTLEHFSLALILGIVAGTYSSIFLAGPILVSWFNWKNRR